MTKVNQPSDADGNTRTLQLTRNEGGHFAYETFTPEQAKASGIDESAFRPLPVDEAKD